MEINAMDIWDGLDLRGRKMIHPPWSLTPDIKTGKFWPQPSETFTDILILFQEEGGSDKDLFDLLTVHMPVPDYVLESSILFDSERHFSLEFYFYFFTFCKILLKDRKFHCKNRHGQLNKYHYMTERGYLKHPPWVGDDKKREGYLSLVNTRALIVYAEEVVSINETASEKRTGCQIADEVLLYMNQLVDEQYRVTRQFFDKEEVLISFEYLINMVALFEFLLNTDDYISEAFRYGFLHSHHLVHTYFLQAGKSPSRRFKEWLLSTNSVYHLSFTEKRKAVSVRVDISRLIEADMIGPYFNNSFSRIKQAVPAIFRTFFEIATDGKVRVNTVETDTMRFTVHIKWSHPLQFFIKSLILSGFWAASGFLLFIFNHLNRVWINPLMYTAFSLTILTLFSRLKTLRKHQEKIRDLIASQMNSLDTVTKELMQERECLYLTVQERTKELEAAVDQLKDLDKSKTNFIANVSHELRTPLTLISTPLDEIQNSHYGDTIKKDHPVFNLMKRNVCRLQRQISQLLDFTRFDLGILTSKMEPLNIIKFCSALVTEIHSLAESRGLYIRFINRTQRDDIFIEADIVQMETLMINLVGNALKFTNKGGVSIVISGAEFPSEIQISVRDTGIGFSAEEQMKIFERFFQVEANKERRYEGAGLGLALVNEIVQRHMWTIEAEGIPDRGASFTLKIPESTQKPCEGAQFPETAVRVQDIDSQAGPTEWMPENRDRNGGDRILLVDDNPDMAAILSEILSSRYIADWSPGGPEALARLSKERDYCLVICDMMMPGMSGLDFRKRFLELYPDNDIPFIYLTAMADHSIQNSALEMGGIDYILKPFNSRELLLKINNLIHTNRCQYTKALRDAEGVERLLRLNDLASTTCTDDFMNLFKITKSEKKVIALLKRGLQDKEIAGNLNISPRTVSTHLRNIYKKTKTQNRVELLGKLYD